MLSCNGVPGVNGLNGLQLAMMTQQILFIKIQVNTIQNVAELVTVFELRMVAIPLLQLMTQVAIVLMRINLKKKRMQITQREVFNCFYVYNLNIFYFHLFYIFSTAMHLKTDQVYGCI